MLFGVYILYLLDEILSRPVSWSPLYERVFFGGLGLFLIGQGIRYLKVNRRAFLKEVASRALAASPGTPFWHVWTRWLVVCLQELDRHGAPVAGLLEAAR